MVIDQKEMPTLYESFLFKFIQRLVNDQDPAIAEYQCEYLKNHDREAYLLKFNISDVMQVSSCFTGYQLRDYHLSVDRYYSNQLDWLSLAHATLVYDFQSDHTIKVHVYFNPQINLWSIRANKTTISSQTETVFLNHKQVQNIKALAQNASLLLENLLSQCSKRYQTNLEKTHTIDLELSELSRGLTSEGTRNEFRSKAKEFQKSLDVLDSYGSLNEYPTAAAWSLVKGILKHIDDLDRKILKAIKAPLPDVELETDVQNTKVVEPLPKINSFQREEDLHQSLKHLLLTVPVLHTKTNVEFFSEFSIVDQLQMVVAELSFCDSKWRKPVDFSAAMQQAECILKKILDDRTSRVDNLADGDFEVSIFEKLCTREHTRVLRSIFSYYFNPNEWVNRLKHLDERRESKHMQALDWYFAKKPNIYQSFLRFIVDNGMPLILPNTQTKEPDFQCTLLFMLYFANCLELFKKLLAHGINPNQPGCKSPLELHFSSLLRSIIALPHQHAQTYLEALLKHGAILNYKTHHTAKMLESDPVHAREYKLFSLTSDFWASCYQVEVNPSVFLVPHNTLLDLTLGLYAFLEATNSKQHLVLDRFKKPGITYCSSDNDLRRTIMCPDEYSETAFLSFKLSLIPNQQYNVSHTLEIILKAFTEKAHTLDVVNKGLLELFNKTKMTTSYEKELWGSIKLLLIQRTCFKGFNLTDAKTFLKAFFKADENIEDNQRMQQQFHWLLSIFRQLLKSEPSAREVLIATWEEFKTEAQQQKALGQQHGASFLPLVSGHRTARIEQARENRQQSRVSHVIPSKK